MVRISRLSSLLCSMPQALHQSILMARRYKEISSVSRLVHIHGAYLRGSSSSSLDLGCGSSPQNPFSAQNIFGVDIRSDLDKQVVHANLAAEPIPFGSCVFDYCTAFDFLEHIPRLLWINGKQRLPFVELLNEVYRVLKHEALFLHSTPSYPSKHAMQDPTHVNFITEDTMPCYFCEPMALARNLGYGFTGKFQLIDQRWLGSTHCVTLMKALKDT